MQSVVRRAAARLALAAALVGAGGCSDSPTGAAALGGRLEVTPDIGLVAAGDTLRLAAEVVDSEGRRRGVQARWASSDSAVATIDAAGLVRGVRPGSVRIFAAGAGDTTSAGVTVTPPVATLQLPAPTDTLRLGVSARLYADARDSLGRPMLDAWLEWSSSDTGVVAVDDVGRLRATGVGDATVTVRAPGKSASVAVHVRLKRIGAERSWMALDSGDEHACALDASGEAYCWGVIPNSFSEPIGSVDPEPVAGGHRFVSVDATYRHSCALEADGTAWCWGRNTHGELGQGRTSPQRSDTPLLVAGGERWKFIMAEGHGGTCGIRASDDILLCFGHNDFFQLGRRQHPADTVVAPWGGGIAARSAAGNHFHTCVLALDGAAFCSGAEGAALGSGDSEIRESERVAVAGGLRFGALALGRIMSCGLTTAGAAHCWGYNDDGALGSGGADTVRAFSPRPVAGGHTFASITAGHYHACAVTPDGAGWCWGRNVSGELGSHRAEVERVPVRVTGPHRWRSLSAGIDDTCGLTVEGEIYCWGSWK